MVTSSNNKASNPDQSYDELSINSFYSGSDGQLRQATDLSVHNALISSTIATTQKRGEKTSHPWVENPGKPSSRKQTASKTRTKYLHKQPTTDGKLPVATESSTIRKEEYEINKNKGKKRTQRGFRVPHSKWDKDSWQSQFCFEGGGDSAFNDNDDQLSKASSRTSTSENSKSPSARGNNKQSKSKFGSSTTVQSVTAISVAAIAGGLVLGPVGVLLGTGALACAGIYHSLPKEQRQQLIDDTRRTWKETCQWGEKMSDHMSMSCATAFEKTGDVVGLGCDSPGNDKTRSSTRFGVLLTPTALSSQSKNARDSEAASERKLGCSSEEQSEVPITGSTDKRGSTLNGKENIGPIKQMQSKTDTLRQNAKIEQTLNMEQPTSFRREGSSWSIKQIHALAPSLQPQAWLGVICNDFVTNEEITEAMEEIVCFAKDKHHGRMFLEEGILDPLLSIIQDFFQQHASLLKQKEEEPAADETQELFQKACESHQRARLAANVCIALGKAHCAVVHTEGDLLLMSSYRQGRVPEGRQLAQMLYEIPHQTRKPRNGNDSPVSVEGLHCNNLEFSKLTELSLNQAEELSKLIKDLTEGKMNPLFAK